VPVTKYSTRRGRRQRRRSITSRRIYSYAEPVLRAAHAAGVRARVVPGITAATADPRRR
jgi:precorrin-3B methylase